MEAQAQRTRQLWPRRTQSTDGGFGWPIFSCQADPEESKEPSSDVGRSALRVADASE